MPSTMLPAAAPGLPVTTRRRALVTLAAAGAALAASPKACKAMAADPIPALHAEKLRVTGLLGFDARMTDAEADILMDQWGDCDRAAIANPATTLAGAAVSIAWAREELMQFGFRPDNPDNGTHVVLALLDGALGVLRAQGGAA